MQDLTPILIIVAIALGVGGFFLFQRQQRKKDEPAPVSAPVPVAAPAPDVAALQAALKQAIDKLAMSTPAVPVAVPVAPPVAPAVVRQPDGTIPAQPKLGTTAPTWQAPPPPWPIDARYLSAEQVATLTPEQTGRANMWAQAFMSSGMTGNGQNPVPAALMIYRAGFSKPEDMGKPLDAVWRQIFETYGVPIPVVGTERGYPVNPLGPGGGREAYDVRLQGYSAENPYVTKPE